MTDKIVNRTGPKQHADKEMAGSIHTLGLLMSKLRSSLEAGKEQSRVWIEYACSVTKMILYSSFGAPLVFLGSPCVCLERVRNRFEDTNTSTKNNPVYSHNI